MPIEVISEPPPVFNDSRPVDWLQLEDAAVALRFGRFGREENTVVAVTQAGAITMKILKRTAHFEDEAAGLGSQLAAQAAKLNVPRKTKLFVDQANIPRWQCHIW